MSLDKKFDGPMEALVGAVDLGVSYARELLHAKILGVLLLGGIASGVFAEFCSRRLS